MGILSKAWKGLKNIFSGVGNFFKSAFSSKNIWKTVAVGAGVYFGGAALGYWDSPVVKSINGAWKDTALGSDGTLGKWLGVDSATKSTDRLREANAADAILPQTPSAPRGSAFVDSSTPIGQSSPVSVQAPAYVSSAARDAAESTGIVGQAMDKVGKGLDEVGKGWDYLAESRLGKGVGKVASLADAHPMAASMALSAISDMTADDPESSYDIARNTAQGKADATRANFEVGRTPNSPNYNGQGLVAAGMGGSSAMAMNTANVADVQTPMSDKEAKRMREKKFLEDKDKETRRRSRFGYVPRNQPTYA
jgi:hypothetical protein